jgi:hypothetical protein
MNKLFNEKLILLVLNFEVAITLKKIYNKKNKWLSMHMHVIVRLTDFGTHKRARSKDDLPTLRPRLKSTFPFPFLWNFFLMIKKYD